MSRAQTPINHRGIDRIPIDPSAIKRKMHIKRADGAQRGPLVMHEHTSSHVERHVKG
jgi:hypothetical protein